MEKVILEKDSFMALASDTRIDLLKKLDERKMTISELSREMNISKPGILKHLSKLCDAGLVKKVESDRKWIYYSLTQKGKNILYPDRAKIILLLSSSIVFLLSGIIYLVRYYWNKASETKLLGESYVSAYASKEVFPYIGIILLIISGLLASFAIFYKIRNRRIK